MWSQQFYPLSPSGERVPSEAKAGEGNAKHNRCSPLPNPLP